MIPIPKVHVRLYNHVYRRFSVATQADFQRLGGGNVRFGNDRNFRDTDVSWPDVRRASGATALSGIAGYVVKGDEER